VALSDRCDAFIVAGCFSASGCAGFAGGDGVLRLAYADGTWRSVPLGDAGILALAPHPGGSGFLCGTDSGQLLSVDEAGAVTLVAAFPRKWVEHIACHAGADPKFAVSVGKSVHLYSAEGVEHRVLAHSSTVTGIAFDAKGKRIAVSHYGGASLWFAASKSDTPRVLDWKGSHTGVVVHPTGDAVVTAMQENALHGWRLSDGQHMRMTGYPTKTESMAFTRTGKWLASAGADATVLWPFFGGGPMGKAPLELGGGESIVCTRVATHPKSDVLASGFADGGVMLIDIDQRSVLSRQQLDATPVTVLSFDQSGRNLAVATEGGSMRVWCPN
jgi:WD40 repeat protein